MHSFDWLNEVRQTLNKNRAIVLKYLVGITWDGVELELAELRH